MKKLLLLMFVSLTATAQKDVTKFLGIPVDGYKDEMKKNLIGKGFKYNSRYDNFSGEFNGYDVNVYIATNNNKVWRVMVCDANTCGEGDIKIRFNNLCRQFSKNKKYLPVNLDEKEYIISDDEDISYEMLVKNKRYQASYYQAVDPSKIDTLALQNRVREAIMKEYTEEQIENPTDKQLEHMESIKVYEAAKYAFEIVENKLVWFMISEKFGKYYISLFYDNEYNHSDGEDL